MTEGWQFGRDAIHVSMLVESSPLITIDNTFQPGR
jgi:hypothetical protein